MADRYQDRTFPSADQARGESDPLAELARLIGQNDPLGAPAKPAPHPLQSRANVRPQQYDPPEEEPVAPSNPPSWMQRARHETPLPPPPLPQEYDDEPEYQQPAPVHPLHRYTAQPPQAPAHQAPPAQDYYEEPQQRYAEQPQQQYADEPQQDPSRYDDALYGRLETGERDYQRDPAYPDDPYAYQGEYEEEPAPKKRSSGLMMVAAVLALAVVGTGGAFAYRTFVGSPRSGEPPIIKADNSPTKVVPAAPSDAGGAKNLDRMLSGGGGEKLVSREETPVDVNSRSGGPRVVFPPLNQNANPPPASSVSPSAPMATAANGTMPNNEPRRIRTLAVKGDPADNGGVPAGASAPPKPPTRGVAAPAVAPGPGPTTPPARNPASANASANAADVAFAAGRFPAADPDGGDQSGPDGRPGRWWLSRPGVLAEERGRRAGVLSRAPGQVPERAGTALVAGETCRSRRKGRLLPRLRRPVRLVRGGGAALQQPEICRRAVLRPKELAAVSLTRVL